MTSLHRDPKLRASDADRDHVAELLRENAATGRLTMDEFSERLERCFAAQTYGDLDALVADLPAPDQYSDLPVPAGSSHATRPPGWTPHQAPSLGEGLLGHHGQAAWGSWASASVICWGIWLATVVTGGGIAGLWPVWVTVPWGGVLLAGALTGGDEHSGPPALPPGPPRPPSLP
jgi:Domain of unknown function (DUF1707)